MYLPYLWWILVTSPGNLARQVIIIFFNHLPCSFFENALLAMLLSPRYLSMTWCGKSWVAGMGIYHVLCLRKLFLVVLIISYHFNSINIQVRKTCYVYYSFEEEVSRNCINPTWIYYSTIARLNKHWLLCRKWQFLKVNENQVALSFEKLVNANAS